METRLFQGPARNQKSIYSLLPDVNKNAIAWKMKTDPDFQKVFQLFQFPEEQIRAKVSTATHEFDGSIMRVFQMHPWDCSWRPPLVGDPLYIADDLKMAVQRAICRVPPFDLVKCGLGYSNRAKFVGAVLDNACTVRNYLRKSFEDFPGAKDIYVQVEQVLRRQESRLAHWIVASSISKATNTPYDAIALDFAPIPVILTKNESLVLKRLDELDQQFPYINEKCNWDECSVDVGFWEDVQKTLWPSSPGVLHYVADSQKQRKDGTVGISSKVRSVRQRLRAMLRSRARSSPH